MSKWKIKDIYWVEGWRWMPRLDKVEKCSRMEVRKRERGRMGRGRDGFGETTGQSSLKPAKPISFVLGRFYHGAVYHRLPKQCRCCSHCEPRPDLHPLRSSNTPPRWGVNRSTFSISCHRDCGRIEGRYSSIPYSISLTMICDIRSIEFRIKRIVFEG